MASKLAVVIGVVAVVLAIVGMAGPWWTESFSGTGNILGIPVDVNGNANYGLFGVVSTVSTPRANETNTSTYSQAPHVGSVFSLGTVLLAIGLVLGIGMVALSVMPNPRFRRIAAVLGVVAFLFALLAPLYVMSALPDAVNADSGSTTTFTTVSGFWGTKSTSLFSITTSITWGAGWGWYFPLVAAVLFLIGAVVLLAARRPAMPAPQVPSA